MAVGTLNVAVTATTYQARKELNGLRGEVNGLAGGVASSTRSLHAHQDIVHGLKDSYKGLHHAVVALYIIPRVFEESRKFGEGLGDLIGEITADPLSDGFDEALHAAKAFFGYVESHGDQYIRQMEQRQKILDAEGEALKKAAEAEREKFRAIEESKQTERDRALSAKEGKNAGLFAADERKFGRAEALNILEAREQADAAEMARDEKKKAKEDAARKAKEAADKREEKRQEQEKALLALRNDVANFWLSDIARERVELMKQLDTPQLRAQAWALFHQQDAQLASKNSEDDRRSRVNLLRDSGAQGLTATDADSVQGFAQRTRFTNSGKVNKIAEKQLKEQERIRIAVEKSANRGPVIVLHEANLAGG